MRRVWASNWGRVAAICLAAALSGSPWPAVALTLEQALGLAYRNNPDINAERARLRAVDEGIPQARAGLRPQINAGLDAGLQAQRDVPRGIQDGRGATTERFAPRGAGITVSQPVFDGLRTQNRVRLAETDVRGAREALRNVEQNIFIETVQAYVDVLRDTAIVDLRRRDLQLLQEQLRLNELRLRAGEARPTDVAQAESRVGRSQSALADAESDLAASRSTFLRIVGTQPNRLVQPRAPERRVPRSFASVIAEGERSHPAIQAAKFGVDSAQIQVKVAESGLQPRVSIDGSLSQRWDVDPGGGSGAPLERQGVAQLVGRVTIPLYDGGLTPSEIRESKQTLGQRRFELDSVRRQVRDSATAAWAALEAARSQLAASEVSIRASEIALRGVQEEFRAGTRTAIEVLNAQQELLDSRVNRIIAERNRVLAVYTLIAALGNLNARTLGLATDLYDPAVNTDQVRDLWGGLRTPDGR